MKIVVLGGAGYIGSHASRELLDQGYEVVVIDSLQTGYEEALDKRVKFYKGDIKDREFMSSVFTKEKDIESVMHFAASLNVGESMEVPLKYYDNNMFGTQVVLETMVKYNVKNIIFSSTAAVYGVVEEYPITEEFVTNPFNAYGETKLAMENMIKWTSLAHGLNYVALRYFNVAGAHKSGDIGEAHPEKSNLIPIILQVAQGKREKLGIFGTDYDTKDGTCIRDYIHIEDLVDAHILSMKYLKDGGKSDFFNLGTGEGYTVLEMLESARKVTNCEIKAEDVGRRSGDPVAVVAAAQKAKSILGWSPKRLDINETIESSWNFKVKNPDGFRK